MNLLSAIEKLKSRLGVLSTTPVPHFKEALIHRSYAAENNLSYDNQRLEFLGDAVLEIILTEYLFNLYPDAPEGDMTKLRSAMVREETLAQLARDAEFGELLFLGKGEIESHGSDRESTLADLYEAILGAWYLDCGLSPVRDFVIKAISYHFSDPATLLKSLNPKGLLQEYSQRRWGAPPTYHVISQTGPEHSPVYTVEVSAGPNKAQGFAQSRKSAESKAAEALLEQLKLE